MKRIHFSGLFAFVLLISQGVFVAKVAAQEADEHSAFTCGSDWARQLDYEKLLENTRQNNPALFDRMVARSKGLEQPSLAAGETFFVTDYSTGTLKSIQATLVHEGDDALIWLADEYLSSVDESLIAGLVAGLESKVKEGPATLDPNKGIIANDIEIFGEPVPDKWSSGSVKLHILLLNIVSPISGGSIEGYFSPYDQTSRPGSNERNLLYVDLKQLVNGNQEDVEDVLGTVAHEFQHLINYSRYNGPSNKTHWIYNEGLSEVASIRNGYWERDGGEYLKLPNRFSYFDAPTNSNNADTILRGYERSMLWLHYLSERFGDEFLYNLVAATGSSLEPVRSAMHQSGNGSDVEKVMGEFWVANYVQAASGFQGEDEYRYTFPVSSRPSATVNKGGAPQQVRKDSMSILPYAAYYPRYPNVDAAGTGLKVKFPSNENWHTVHVVLYRPDGSIEVQPMNLDEEYLFTGFTTAVFAIANVSSGEQTFHWTVERVELSGVEDYATTKGVLAFSDVVPNPVRGNAQFRFSTAKGGRVQLDLFDVRGGLVQQALNAERYSSGEQSVTLDLSNLPAGVYTVRLQDESGAMAVRQVVVVK